MKTPRNSPGNATILTVACAGLLTLCASTALACEYIAGETKFVDYAKCRYGDDAILVVSLPAGSGWEKCIYHVQAFRPEELLAVTKEANGRETLSINDRGQIGNPCYLSKRKCDAALQALKDSGEY
jgi:hypothetical protein